MDTQMLKTFLTLAKLKNFTKTAEQLFVAQSTVTNRIALLEAELGKSLFLRNKRNISLTPEGLAFKQYAKRILDMEEAAFHDIHSIKQYDHILTLGCTNTIYECHLYSKICEWIATHKEDALKITIGHSDELLLSLQDGLLDLVYCYKPLYKNGYVSEIFAVDELVLVTSSEHDFYQKGLYKEELSQTPYLYCNFALQEIGSFIRELFPPHYQFGFEIDNSTKLIPYLLDIGGISFLPESLAAPYLRKGALRKIPLLDFEAPKINCYRILRES